jgi:hypothetical protein
VTIPTAFGAPDTTALETFAETTYTTTLDADQNPATDDLNAMVADLETYQNDSFTTTLDADTSAATSALDAVTARADAWDTAAYEAAILADASDASSDIAEAIRLGNAFAGTYTATLTADISPVRAAVQEAADLLPSSPAKKGPLSKDADFGYVVEAFVAAMNEIGALADDERLTIGSAVRDSVRANETALAARGIGGSAASGLAGTYVDARQFYALKTDEYARLLSEAERGAGAHDWIARRERAFSTVGG